MARATLSVAVLCLIGCAHTADRGDHLATAPGSVLRGRAVHKGLAVAGAEITVYARGSQQPLGKTQTDAEGRFELTGLPVAVELEVVAAKLRDDSWLLTGSGRTSIRPNAMGKMQDISLGAMPPPVSTPDTPPIAPKRVN